MSLRRDLSSRDYWDIYAKPEKNVTLLAHFDINRFEGKIQSYLGKIKFVDLRLTEAIFEKEDKISLAKKILDLVYP